MEKESLKRYLIFLAALIVCAGAAWYFSKDAEDVKDNAVLAGSRNLIIDLGTMGAGRKETEEAKKSEAETENKTIQDEIIRENEAKLNEVAEDIGIKGTIMERQAGQSETAENIRTKENIGEKNENTEITEERNDG